MPSVVESYRGSRNLHTPHRLEEYSGPLVASCGWALSVVCLKPGDSFVALGGEHCLTYETPSGTRAQGFTLSPGDRATVVAWDDATFLAEWRVERG